MKYRAQFALALCALAACGKVEDRAEPGAGGDGPVVSGGGGTGAVSRAGSAGRERLASAGDAALGGSTAGSIALGAAAGDGGLAAAGSLAGASEMGGSAGEDSAAGQGGASGRPERVRVNADGIVFVTYTPASDQTKVTVRLDPNCELYGSTVTASESTCAWIDVTGEVIGDSQVCFARPAEVPLDGNHAKFFMQSFYPGNPSCGGLWATMRIVAGVQYCPELIDPHYFNAYYYIPQQWLGKLVCMPVTKLRYVGYTNRIDLDDDYNTDSLDNCPTISNILQFDTDKDGVGDECDNCPVLFNPDQLDTNHNGVGDACESTGGGGGNGSGAGC